MVHHVSVFDRPSHHEYGGHMLRIGKKVLSHTARSAFNHYMNKREERRRHRTPHANSRRHPHDKEERIVGSDTVSGINASRMAVTLHKPLKGYIRGTFVRTNEAYQVSSTSLSGLQGVFTICELGGMANVIGATNGHASVNDYAIAAYQVIPDMVKNSDPYYPAIATSKTQRLALRHTQLDMQFVSGSTANQTIKVFVVKAKCNIPNDPTVTAGQFIRKEAIEYWGDSLALENVGRTTQTISDTGGGNPGFEIPGQPGASPSECRTFKRLYSIEAEHTIHLAPNGVEILNLSIWNNQVMDVGKILALSAGGDLNQAGNLYNTGMLKGGFAVFAINLGQPVKDTGVAGSTKQYTYAPAEVGVIVARKSAWAGLPVKSEQYNTIQAENNLLVNMVGRPLKNQQNVNITPDGVSNLG